MHVHCNISIVKMVRYDDEYVCYAYREVHCVNCLLVEFLKVASTYQLPVSRPAGYGLGPADGIHTWWLDVSFYEKKLPSYIRPSHERSTGIVVFIVFNDGSFPSPFLIRILRWWLVAIAQSGHGILAFL
jgi:hypothetical protein